MLIIMLMLMINAKKNSTNNELFLLNSKYIKMMENNVIYIYIYIYVYICMYVRGV